MFLKIFLFRTVPLFALFTLIFVYQFVKFIELFLVRRVQVLYFILHRVSLVLHQKLKYLDKKIFRFTSCYALIVWSITF